ncbi:twin-arginine translocase subunit TatC [Actinophytocola sp.]|uniref:twin-arginine translocase subunit TatC n=1 Tax=Actinophytocola sp. TaxID=1872138 RepID=UPI0039C8BD5E
MARDQEDRAGRRERRRLRSRRHNPDGTMTLRDHIYELRHRLGLALLFILIGGAFGFFWFQTRFGPVPSLSQLLMDPYCALPAGKGGVRIEFDGNGCKLLQTQPFEAFLTQFKVGVAAGMVLTAPLWLYQVWAFITPGLYAREKKFALNFVLFASLLFAAGAVLAYFVVPQGLRVLVSFGGDAFITALAADKYISFVLVLLLIFGVSFELPLLIVMLNKIGMLPYANLKKWRRGILFALFVFAAFATPGTDPVSMVALGFAMAVLFELAVQIARIHDRRKAKREALSELGGLDDNEASPVYEPEQVEPEPVSPGPGPESRPGSESRPGWDDVT